MTMDQGFIDEIPQALLESALAEAVREVSPS